MTLTLQDFCTLISVRNPNPNLLSFMLLALRVSCGRNRSYLGWGYSLLDFLEIHHIFVVSCVNEYVIWMSGRENNEDDLRHSCVKNMCEIFHKHNVNDLLTSIFLLF